MAFNTFFNIAKENGIKYRTIHKEFTNLLFNDKSFNIPKNSIYPCNVIELDDIDLNLLLLLYPKTLNDTKAWHSEFSIYEIIDDKIIKQLR